MKIKTACFFLYARLLQSNEMLLYIAFHDLNITMEHGKDE